MLQKFAAIVPVDSSRWAFADALSVEASDAKGVIHFAGAPGEYLVIVSDGGDSQSSFVEYLRAHADTAPHIKVQAGDNKAITVTLPR